ncbi:gamma-glutamyltranspeptidase/glutathione hydrolase [Glaciihabitans tibetensis]|uniref:Glutathione hydrolase proenzyme n=1 Tax=Glaciihabitans tibetensis TaxID=1266600 RepID=A0A2T0VEA0_9MICO|nr:gamma-glutamyltransferase [Glaciihabitans tibetensis]PRY68470.1 gamma-glutamyltranspeptidase/glutathione hydrolase [Glaciihabitans tibetensis]
MTVPSAQAHTRTRNRNRTTTGGRRIAFSTAIAVAVASLLTAAPAAAGWGSGSGGGYGGGAGGGPGHGTPGGDHGGEQLSQSTSVGTGGAVSSVDAAASQVGLEVLRLGGNAADAAVATAAALGVTEPYSAGIGGGGYFVYYDAETGEVSTIDGRETAPAGITPDAFVDPATSAPYRFTPELVSSGVSVGVPGTLATWDAALENFGTQPLGLILAPSILLAAHGFEVDETFRSQTLDNKERFAAFPDTAELFLPGGDAPQVGTTFRNPDLAKTLSLIALKGPDAFYGGALAAEIADVVQNPRIDPASALPAPAGTMTTEDLANYAVIEQEPTQVSYRGLDVYGMAPSSSGGTTVGEALNILENVELTSGEGLGQSLHYFLEASAHAFADRGAYLGDPAFVDVPTETLLSQEFADTRFCAINPDQASQRPVAAGVIDTAGGGVADVVDCTAPEAVEYPETENVATTHLSVVDREGNAVAYTLTIEQTGGSGMTVPNRGFLLNNELTDFSTVYNAEDPNRIEPGKRPRSSMSPTIVLEDGSVRFVLGSPGGATIITTVLQILMNRIDLGMTLPEAVAAPRASQRNAPNTPAEPAFIEAYSGILAPFGQQLVPSGDSFSSAAEIGAAAAIEVDPSGTMTAVAEPVRRGGGTGLVVYEQR